MSQAMSDGQLDGVPVVFTGTRRELGAILLRGYGLLVPTVGLYRFWLTTWKRRFYWSHTEIDGDALEYTGHAAQLLLGFLLALAVFVPVYGLFFYLSTQNSTTVVIGYGGLAIVLWFAMGYAIYRARDFRLSRTLWRGIRFDQTGSAWGYALRRFGWTLLVMATAGFAYPLMAANLWRYRYRHTWFGDRQFGFTGSWRDLMRPFVQSYVAGVVIGGGGLVLGYLGGAMPEGGAPDPTGFIPIVLAALAVGAIVLSYQASERNRMYSAVTLGEARLQVRIKGRSLIGQYTLFGLALVGAYLVLAIGGLVVLGALAGDAFAGGSFDLQIFFGHVRSSLLVLAATILGYLLLLGAFTLMAELVLGLGYWKLLARGATITNIETLRSVRARGEDRSLVGEGLADALNVGAY